MSSRLDCFRMKQQDQKADHRLPEDGTGECLTTKEEPKGILGVMELFCILIVVLDTCLCVLMNRTLYIQKSGSYCR